MIDLTNFKRSWDEYKNDRSLNEYGRLNLVCWMGERAGLLIAEIERLAAEANPAHLYPLIDALEEVGMGKPGMPNNLESMVLEACSELKRLEQERDAATSTERTRILVLIDIAAAHLINDTLSGHEFRKLRELIDHQEHQP